VWRWCEGVTYRSGCDGEGCGFFAHNAPRRHAEAYGGMITHLALDCFADELHHATFGAARHRPSLGHVQLATHTSNAHVERTRRTHMHTVYTPSSAMQQHQRQTPTTWRQQSDANSAPHKVRLSVRGWGAASLCEVSVRKCMKMLVAVL
jgi:hypothetical protein